MGPEQEEMSESVFLAALVDPLAQQILDATDPWAAHKAATAIPDSLRDALEWLPHGGEIYSTWADLADLFETGKTPIPEAHVAVVAAATLWLCRPGNLSQSSIDGWLEHSRRATNRLVERDGTFWEERE